MNKDNTESEDIIDQGRRKFLLRSSGILGAIGTLCALTPFVSSWLPSAKVQAQEGPVSVDLSHMKPGELMVLSWRGKPLWILKRTPEMLRNLTLQENLLRDPHSLVDQQPEYAKNTYRSINPDYLVLIGVCTHLGCTPKYKSSLSVSNTHVPGGFFCPCHGSTFDLAGRVFKGVPAPINLEVPPYKFIDSHTLVVGAETS